MFEVLRRKVMVLNDLMWDRKLTWGDIEQWLAQFKTHESDTASEAIHALYLLSNFTLYNTTLTRALFRALYRDYVQYPIIARLRRDNHHTLDLDVLTSHYRTALKKVRFVALGNPSESSAHLLYYFRQENELSKHLFVNSHELIDDRGGTPKLTIPVSDVVVLDDFCGSGRQALRYSRGLVRRLRSIHAEIQISYFPLFATEEGLRSVRRDGGFQRVESPCRLDDSFRALEARSRYFRHGTLSRQFALTMCSQYGALIEPKHPLGFGRCQLLLGFEHNIPNNTLPIFWSAGSKWTPWKPLFPRHQKVEGMRS